jgi:putative transposase
MQPAPPGARARICMPSLRVIVTPLMAPMANARAERWVRSCRRECLDWMLIVNQRHLEAELMSTACTTTMSARIGVGTCDRPLPVAIRSLRRLGRSAGRFGSVAY